MIHTNSRFLYPTQSIIHPIPGIVHPINGISMAFLSTCPALSAMIRGAHDGALFQVCDYSEEEVEGILTDYFDKLAKA